MKELARELKTDFIGHTVLCYETIDSTNDVALRLGEQGTPEGVCVFAEYQKKGRGRLGRSWISPKGQNILLSILLRPDITPVDVSKITLVAAVSLVKAIEQATGRMTGIKWPNDVQCKGKKVAGILTEMNAETNRVHFVVTGIGINVNADANQLPSGSTSLKDIAGREVSRIHFMQIFLERFELDYKRFKAGKFAELAEDWENFSVTSGKRVSVNVQGRQIQGQATGIDENGALWVRTDNGLQEKIVAGDVRLLRENQ